MTSTGNLPSARFPGQWFQSESGLHQNWMRDYDPTTGRYMEPDPLGLIDGASIYGYVRQSPMMLTDPTGECPWCVVAAGAAIGAGISLLMELWMNDWRWECVNWANVGIGGAVGAFSGGWGTAWRAGATGAGRTGTAAAAAYRKGFGLAANSRVHHAIFSAGGQAARRAPGWQHSWWNYRAVPYYVHKQLHKYATVPQLSWWNHWRYGTPTWLLWAEGSVIGGSILELGMPCGCEN